MNFRTDLAVENITENTEGEKIHIHRRGKSFNITEIIIDDDSLIETVGKGKGRYVTLEGELKNFSSNYEEMAIELADEIKKFIPNGDILVAGLGNRDITPDALGVLTAEKVLATRHLKDELKQEDEMFLMELRRVSTFAGGVLGQTGIETAEVVKALCREIKPSGVIAIDALACSDISRLGTTIQISDTGISPGSGVSNARQELSESLLEIPVIAIGIPTVVSIYTIVKNVTGKEPQQELPDFMVTPRDTDRLTERSAQLLAFGINLALHPKLNFNDVRGLF